MAEFASDQLKAFVERIERLDEEKHVLNEDIREVFAEAKATGALRAVDEQFYFSARVRQWLTALDDAVCRTAVTGPAEWMGLPPTKNWPLTDGLQSLIRTCAHQSRRSGRIFLFGNGGSLGTAAHMATDFSLLGWPAIALIDPVAITSHTNDFGAPMNFGTQLDLLQPSAADVCIALSCSGASPNILYAVSRARALGLSAVFTFSGFAGDNPLRSAGTINFYVPCNEYGLVQLAHEAILHMACDFAAEMK